MHDLVESAAICLSLGIVFTPLIGFVLFLGYIRRKEKAALAQYKE